MSAVLDVLRPRDPAGDVRRRRVPVPLPVRRPAAGRRYMGCLHKVFATEIDVELFREAERTRQGLRRGELAARAAASAAVHGRAGATTAAGCEADRCVNRRFFDWPDAGTDAVRAFDLRDRCQP